MYGLCVEPTDCYNNDARWQNVHFHSNSAVMQVLETRLQQLQTRRGKQKDEAG
jgi:hypothetical protein